MAEGEFALVRQYLESAIDKDFAPNMTSCGDQDLYALLADIATQQHDVAGLRQYTPLAEETAQHCNHPLYAAVAQRAWGVLHRQNGELDQADARLEGALAQFQELGTRWQLGRTYAELAEVARARPDRQLARSHYQQALSLFEAMKAAPDLARTQQTLAELG